MWMWMARERSPTRRGVCPRARFERCFESSGGLGLGRLRGMRGRRGFVAAVVVFVVVLM